MSALEEDPVVLKPQLASFAAIDVLALLDHRRDASLQSPCGVASRSASAWTSPPFPICENDSTPS